MTVWAINTQHKLPHERIVQGSIMTPQSPSQTCGVLFKISKMLPLPREGDSIFLCACPETVAWLSVARLKKKNDRKSKTSWAWRCSSVVKDLTSQDREANWNRTELAAGQRGHWKLKESSPQQSWVHPAISFPNLSLWLQLLTGEKYLAL